MKPNIKLTEKSAPNFHSNEQTFLVKCPECERENWALAVATGICAWCRYDLNKTKLIINENKETNK